MYLYTRYLAEMLLSKSLTPRWTRSSSFTDQFLIISVFDDKAVWAAGHRHVHRPGSPWAVQHHDQPALLQINYTTMKLKMWKLAPSKHHDAQASWCLLLMVWASVVTVTDGTALDPPRVSSRLLWPPQHREDGVSCVVSLRGDSSYRYRPLHSWQTEFLNGWGKKMMFYWTFPLRSICLVCAL